MKSFTILFSVLLFAVASALAEGKKIVLFAVLTEDTPVTLAEGPQWNMDKGDAFPVLMFKEQQTKVVLQKFKHNRQSVLHLLHQMQPLELEFMLGILAMVLCKTQAIRFCILMLTTEFITQY
jgi:hypothetical protein